MPAHLDSRRFRATDQRAFARLSGDVNPIHLDSTCARRTIAGQCIVHGVHAALWVLDAIARRSIAVAGLQARFLKPMFLDEEIACIWDESSGKAQLSSNGTPLVEITLSPQRPAVGTAAVASVPGREAPADRSFEEAAGMPPQAFDIHGESDLAGTLFPDATRLYGQQLVCELAALSYIVGMEVPGMHSLFSGLRVGIHDLTEASVFSIAGSDERFKRLLISVTGRSLNAEIEAFQRPAPTSMPPLRALRHRVRPNEHAGVTALVVGGSRGLGEVAAKLIAAGGGRVTITYRTGEEDAYRVVDDIRRSGGDCQARQLIIGEGAPPLGPLPAINQLYYFATPKIFGKRAGGYDDALYRSLRSVYVTGFEDLCKTLLARRGRRAVFYPSTVAIDAPPPELQEYALAKSEGEALCQRINDSDQITILAPRLPRTATDQTLSILQVPAEDPVDLLAPFVRRMTELTR
ncbi:MAG: hypothetical protein KDH20_03320 [Rhodocyclaceae bacterium]|nr:hypothetical protein [Rhodocyclaceae bacterium]